jgi:signal transduction histidine kinase
MVRLGVRSRIVLITVAVLSLAFGANSLIGSYAFTNEYVQVLQSEILVAGRGLRYQLDKILKLGLPLSEIVGFEEQCQDLANRYEEVSYAMVVDTDGTVLFHSDPSQQGLTLTTPTPEIEDEQVIQVYRERGERFYEAIIPVWGTHDEYVGTIRVGFPNKFVAQQTQRVILYSLGVAVVSLSLATVLLVLGLSRWVTNPLDKLLGVIDEIRKGTAINPSLRAEIDSDDEIGQLGSAFNQMLDDLEESQEKVRQYTLELEAKNEQLQRDVAARERAEEALRKAHDQLEDRVAERTAQLSEANARLRREVAERERAEEQLSHYAEELERSNSELEQFAYVASHDLQEPLRMVKSYLQLIERRYKDRLDRDADEFIDFAVDGAERMQTLINDLLQYSRVTTHGEPFTPTDCPTVLEHVLADLSVAIEESGASVTHDDLPIVMADEVQLARLLRNLIGNAIKFRKQDIRPEVHVSAEHTDDAWTFSVRDNGIGIDPKDFECIFMTFQRLHTREEYEGTGIGLAMCKKIVERHGGRIWVESEPGEGSTFYFTVPGHVPRE